jgi:hypothetical protein
MAVSKFPANCRVTADMDVRLTAGAAAGVLMWTGIGQAQVPANTGKTPILVVYVEDRAGLRPGVKEGAEKELVRIFALAGVHAAWKNMLPGTIGTEETGGVPSVTVVVLDAAATKRYVGASGLNAEVMGSAVRGANRAYLLFPRIDFAARFYNRHLGTMVGVAAAHEVGHLLLPPRSHSNLGIMREDIEVRSLVPPQFTSAQAAEMVKTLRTWQQRSSKAVAGRSDP